MDNPYIEITLQNHMKVKADADRRKELLIRAYDLIRTLYEYYPDHVRYLNGKETIDYIAKELSDG